jgi:serine/threonine-protein kinase RsbW
MKDYILFAFSAKMENIRCVRAVTRSFLKMRNVSDGEVFDTELALNEAVANIIEHTYQYDSGQKIVFTLYWDPQQNRGDFFLRDFGSKVEIEKIASRALDKLEDHGLGVHIIQNLMHGMHFENHTIKKGNLLHLYKNYNPIDVPL